MGLQVVELPSPPSGNDRLCWVPELVTVSYVSSQDTLGCSVRRNLGEFGSLHDRGCVRPPGGCISSLLGTGREAVATTLVDGRDQVEFLFPACVLHAFFLLDVGG